MSILTPLPVKESVIEIREFKNRVAIYFTPTEAKNFDNYISHMGINKNYLVDRAIEEFVDNKRPVIKADARQLNYEGEKKTVLRTMQFLILRQRNIQYPVLLLRHRRQLAT